MNEFFKFIFNSDIVEEHLRPEWIKLYDFLFIDNKLIANLNKNAEMFTDLISNVAQRASGGLMNSLNDKQKETYGTSRKYNLSVDNQVDDKDNVAIIIPEPFNLSQPKPKKFREPLALSNRIVVTNKPVP